ncbi:MAG: glycosyltransferase [Bacteroidales bacterium]|jgi:glycosyltransferase involved in cell wall biosynthesis|nr:glycosyltransferase [Bacteroidales bacterium]
MNIISTCKMGPGTFEAKFVPFAQVNCVDNIFVLRDAVGPEIAKVQYLILPKFLSKFRILKFLIPFYLAYYTIKFNCTFIIGYHFVPHAIFAYLASIITNVPFIFAQTGLDIQRLAQKPLFKIIVNIVLKRASYINVPGSFSKNFWSEFGINPHKINILHSTIDTDYWVPDPDKEKIYDFVFLGRLDPVKRIDMIIHAFKLLLTSTKNVVKPTLLIVGSGPGEPALKKQISDIGIAEYVKFTGFVSKPLFYLQKSRFIIMSSFTEGLPTAMMQAMACGVIPVTNLVGNIPDLVADNKTGIVHSGQNPANICRAMKNALAIQDRELSIMKHATREIIVRYHSHEKATKQWANLLSEASQ